MLHSVALRSLCVTALGLLAAGAPFAQPSGVDWGGLAYIDYSYLIASDDPDAEGENGFDYRRIYLTADAALGEGFQARVRLEARGSSTTLQGRPAPFVKDAWLRWESAPEGHRVGLGVQPPPVFTVAEDVWGYRSLDATILDRTGVRDSRDMGLQVDGPLAAGGALRYALMVGNGNGVRPEAPGEGGKRVYAQLQFDPRGPLQATLGADYGEEVPAEGAGRSSTRVSAFVGGVTERHRVGVEAFYVHDDDVLGGASIDGAGVSVFGIAGVSERVSLVGRYDYTDADGGRDGQGEHYGLAAVAYRPAPAVALMPNVLVTVPEGAEATVLGRFTAAFQF